MAIPFTVRNTRNTVVATVNPSSTTGNTFPIELIGEGVPGYPTVVAHNNYALLENFASPTEPTNPVEGMNWYSTANKTPKYFNGTIFLPYGTATSSSSVLFNMLPAATNVNFTSAGSTAIFQAGTDATFHPTSVLLVPNGNPTALTPPAFNLYVNTSEDVMENALVQNLSVGRHAYYSIEGTTAFASDGDSIYIEITTVATGGTANFDVYLFGFTRT